MKGKKKTSHSEKKQKKSFNPKGKNLIEFRKDAKQFASRKFGEYDTILYKRVQYKRKVRYQEVPLTSFKANQYYRVYIKHRSTGRTRLLSFGRMPELPVISKKYTRDLEHPVITASRKFKPLPMPKKAKGKWLPISRYYNKLEADIEEQASSLTQKYKVRGAILPLKRYYNPDLMVFSDSIIKRNAIVTAAYAHVIVAYDYPGTRWISARHVRIDFPKGVRLDHLADHLERKEELATEALGLEHPKANISVLNIQGFIPAAFKKVGEDASRQRTRKGKKKGNRKHPKGNRRKG